MLAGATWGYPGLPLVPYKQSKNPSQLKFCFGNKLLILYVFVLFSLTGSCEGQRLNQSESPAFLILRLFLAASAAFFLSSQLKLRAAMEMKASLEFAQGPTPRSTPQIEWLRASRTHSFILNHTFLCNGI